MLADETPRAFVWTAKPEAARAFYEGVLGLTLVTDSPHLMIFQSGAAGVALVKGETVTPPRGTALGWQVADLRATVRDLSARGVVFFERALPLDGLPIWSPEAGHGVAWFKDPDGNTLSVSGTI
jgi:catechol 2,3-dioxygenase-like lactoylglutathione lyase family enzyme